ncbi:hypothetical protein VKT23_017287 [Stygiomarasmius scandens]|uniref:F-box domain-containing protein n=1 Tax=Marasmiellus scandens TaxID=2682957 RepID=A0ABR1ISS8_9AGAR
MLPRATTTLCHRYHVKLEVAAKPAAYSDAQLRSMHVPSDAHVALLKPLVVECRYDLARYTEEIDRLTHVLAILKERRSQLQQYTDPYEFFVSPIRKLPTEVLTEIFSWACLPSLNIAEDGVHATSLDLAQTCSRRGRILLSRPEFWCHISFNLAALTPDRWWASSRTQYNMGSDCRKKSNLVHLYLRRAKLEQIRRALVLDIGARTRKTGVYACELAMGHRDVIRIFLRLREYWLRVSLDLPYCLLKLFSNDYLPYHGQSGVKAVTLRWEEGLSLGSNSDKLFGLTSSADLQCLELQAFYPKLVYTENWRFNLKTLIIHEPLSINRLQNLFIESNSALQNLEELEFGATRILEEDGPEWPNELPQIVLRNLKSLTYHFDDCKIGPQAISVFHTPLLKSFVIDGAMYPSSMWRKLVCSSIGRMLENSECHLQVLKLDGLLFENIGFEDWAEMALRTG